MTGKKNDFIDNKLRWDLLPLEEIEDIDLGLVRRVNFN